MPHPATPSTADLLLEIVSLAASRPVTTRELSRTLRPVLGNLSERRIDAAVEALLTEGLVGITTPDAAGRELGAAHAAGRRRRASRAPRPVTAAATLHATAAGHDALRTAGRALSDPTILFTDIVDSTQLIDRFGEREAHARRQRHFALSAAVIASHRGRIVKNCGDGLMVEFSAAVDAVGAAAELQRRVAADADGLGLRVGLHTGPVLREGDDLFGSSVIVARRLCDRADAGQILLSDSTSEITGAAHDGTPARALGTLTLKGLAQPVAASALRWRQQRVELPTQQTAVTA